MMNNPFQDDQNPEIQAIKAAMNATKNKRMFERYQTILLHLHGVKYDQIAFIVGRSAVTIGSYVKAYRAHGLNGLVLVNLRVVPPFSQRNKRSRFAGLL